MPSRKEESVADEQTTPSPNSLIVPPTPPPSSKKTYAQAARALRLFEDIEAGRHSRYNPWTTFQLAPGEFDELERRLARRNTLFGFTKDKIRYDFDGRDNQLVVRMPTGLHELFLADVEDAIYTQIKTIRERQDKTASFARKLRPARSTEIFFPVDSDTRGTQSKHEPDTSFWHNEARYPGVIIEIAYSQKKKRLRRLAEDYLLDSDASVRAVLGFDIQYGPKESRKATLSIWRTHILPGDNGDELHVVQEVADEAFRNDDGSPSEADGLRIGLKDFAYEQLVQRELGDEDIEIGISAQQLCCFLDMAEEKVRQKDSLGKNTIAPGVKKRKRSETPPEEMNSADEAAYAEREQRAAKRLDVTDPDFDNLSTESST